MSQLLVCGASDCGMPAGTFAWCLLAIFGFAWKGRSVPPEEHLSGPFIIAFCDGNAYIGSRVGLLMGCVSPAGLSLPSRTFW